ncbi:hypothetical protein BCT30_02850 [Enterovibrio norvegicus]|uniref:Predicted small integral membrane protein n=2 Tax=Enterovibrio norvegicus TaxID=188144 RepID=A0A1I5PMU4_9GAMM|nr:DUF2160 domain-containing protein [Enterovibrio norvegicus]OEE60774.1 hypothetical protein A1OS_19885 [Enterovibrio norvegicus]OEF56421.1 hypothetical protein A1OU_16790 [Enterovibrio norvegicus]PMI32263.1 hypothetical protein BCU47_12795 [Enterovibrio norvegicus]PMI33114.1 hypothetical protein BCU46_03285 [Enterovibrio norvegicus]PMN48336.1 hypothetical protein BCT30_02850 [Enterovibrio norvegicus]
MNWMAWTQPSALFFLTIGCILLVMTTFEVLRPCVARKGFLPITTTRGDRLFIGLLSSAYIHLFFIGMTDLAIWYPFGISIIWLGIVLRWG